MKKISLLLIVLIAIFMAPAAMAEVFTDGTTTIYEQTDGGGTKQESGGVTVYDSILPLGEIFGTPGQGTIVIPGLFGLFGAPTVIPTDEPLSELDDSGRIRNTNIVRNGSDLVISWGFDAQGPTNVKIFAYNGPDIEYDAVVSNFTEIAEIPSNTTIYVDSGKVANGENIYYRVVPEPPLPGRDILAPQNNSITVGEVEINVPANKFDFITLPFMEDGYDLGAILGDQLGDGAEYYYWDEFNQINPGAAYIASSNEWMGDARAMRMGDGFYVRAKSDITLSLVGRFGKLQAPFEKNLVVKPGYNLVGYPYPTSKTVSAMGIDLEEGMDIYKWANYAAYDGAAYTSNGWVPAGVNDLQLGRPRFYRPVASQIWSIDP